MPFPSSTVFLSLHNVGFAYDETPVLRNVTFQLRPGEILGIVGPSGAGKSTLLSLIARLFDPSFGRICLAGTDIRKFRLADLYGAIAMVPQEPFMFSDTARENIRCGRPEATDQEVEHATRAANIHEEILALPHGYDTLLGPGGRGISNGQAQRINIARAVVKNPRLLLLDEATASLDSLSEETVRAALDSLLQARTACIVTHRLSTLRKAHRIIVLDRGECTPSGHTRNCSPIARCTGRCTRRIPKATDHCTARSSGATLIRSLCQRVSIILD